MNTEAMRQEFIKRYGAAEGARVLRTVLPGILADFQKMLWRNEPGTTVTEEYRLDDGKGAIILTGQRNADGTMTVDGRVI